METGNGNEQNKLREFGEFRLDTEKCVLWHLDQPVNLQLKEIELLSVLTESPGEVVTKQELMDRVWPNAFVEESNLSRHIYRIRKTFEEYGKRGLIQTVPRRGYRFTGAVEFANADYVIERHSISRTLVEEIHSTEEPAKHRPVGALTGANWLRHALVFGLVVLVAGVAVALMLRGDAAATDGNVRSIAVLPMRSTDIADANALGSGFADTLTSALGGLNGVKVFSAQPIVGFANDGAFLSDAAKVLGVDAVMEGTLQRANGRLRVALRLIRAGDGKQLWAGSFENAESEIFLLQDIMAAETARAVASTLNLQNRETHLKRYTANADAYQAYLSGRYLHYQGELRKAITEFERALQFDPKYVLAYAGLADSYAVLANSLDGRDRIDMFEKAKGYALQALAMDQDLPEAHAAIGWIRRIYDWDWDESEKHLRRAVELDPTFSQAYQRLSFLYVTLGKTDEAVRFAKKAKQLNPVNHSTSWVLYCDRKFEESAAEYERRMELFPAPGVKADGRLGKAMALLEIGRPEEALGLLEGFSDDEQKQYRIAVIKAISLFRTGQTESANRMLRDLEVEAQIRSGRWVRLAYVYAAMGMNDRSLKALKNGFADRDDRLMWIKTTPYFDPIRQEPRFRNIVSQMGLPG